MAAGAPAELEAQMRRRARRMRRLNVLMRRLLDLPFPLPGIGNSLMLLYFKGRKTGRAYRQPVSYVEDGDVLLTPGGGRWKDNLVEGTPIVARIRGRKRRIAPELVRDPPEVEALLSTMLSRNARLASFVPFIDRDGTVDQRGLARAVEHGFCIVRWRLVDA